MSETPPTSLPSTLLTMHCTSYDYSLEGLPRDGKCPECGTAIDDRFLVIRGTDVGRGMHWQSTLGMFIAVFSSSFVERCESIVIAHRAAAFAQVPLSGLS